MFAAMARLEKGEDKEKIDEAVRTFGMPMGPIELADSVGLDICAHVAASWATIPRLPLDILVKAGKLGKKTGEGFYKWVDGKTAEGQETTGPRPSWKSSAVNSSIPSSAKRRQASTKASSHHPISSTPA